MTIDDKTRYLCSYGCSNGLRGWMLLSFSLAFIHDFADLQIEEVYGYVLGEMW